MSRSRMRRTHRVVDKSRRRKAVFKKLAVVAVALVLCLIGISKAFNAFLHSQKFHTSMEESIGEKIGTPAKLEKMRWDGLHLKNDEFLAQSEGALQEASVSKISLDVERGSLGGNTLRVANVVAQKVNLKLDLTKEFTTYTPDKKKQWYSRFVPKNVEVLNAEIFRANADILTAGGVYSVLGTELDVLKKDYGYAAELAEGRLNLPFSSLSTAELNEGQLRFLNERLVIDQVSLGVFDNGKLEVDGEIDFSLDKVDYEFTGALSGLDCADVINEDWKHRLTGRVESNFIVRPDEKYQPVLIGSGEISNGQLTALPVLDTIAAYTATRDFKRLRFSKFKCEFYQSGDLLSLSKISVYCSGLLRIEGAIDIRGEVLNGEFQVGMNPGTLGHIPGAEEQVFRPGKEGMSWTTVKISGTTSNVEEDLTARLKSAALGRIFEMVGGQEVLKFGSTALDQAQKITEDGVIDTAKDVLGNTKDVLDEPVKAGTDILQSGLDGIFGGGSQRHKNTQRTE